MTNNDELAIKLKAAAEQAKSAMDRYDAGEVDGGEAMELMGDFTDVVLPANILALLAERDADKKRIAELEQNNCGGALMEREEHHVDVVNKLLERIAELEARAVSVKLPKKESEEAIAYAGSGAFRGGRVFGFNEAIDIMSERLTAAGIKLEVGE